MSAAGAKTVPLVRFAPKGRKRKINPPLRGTQKPKYLFVFLKLIPLLFETNIKIK